MTSRSIQAFLLLSFVAAQAVAADVLRFDMGTERSELRSGFTRVTAASLYDRATGFGWKSADGLKEHYRYYDRQWQYNESRGRQQPPEIYTNEITCDTIAGRKPNSFLIDLAPGVYQGKLAFRAADHDPASVPVKLRVLPIRLAKNPEHIYGMYYRDPLASVDPRNTPQANDYFRRKAELERRDMLEHGMNTHISGVSGLNRDDQGNWTMDGEETDRRIAMDRKYGLADKPLVVSFPVGTWYARLVGKRGLGSHLRLVRPDVPQSFFDEVTKMVEAIEKERRVRRWPELLYYPIDEPSTGGDAVRFMVGVLRAVKLVPGVRTYVTADPSKDAFEPMWPYVDVWCCQPFVFGCEKIRQLSRGRKIELVVAGRGDRAVALGLDRP